MPFRVLIVGFGAVGAGLADDPKLRRYYRTITHAQSIATHPAFELSAVVDSSEAAQRSAREEWRAPIVVSTLDDLDRKQIYDVAVVSTPPTRRIDTLRRLPQVRAILLEKPLAQSVGEAQAIEAWLAERRIACQTGFWRRADRWSRSLACGELREMIGTPLSVSAYYCRGFRNNASHLIDYIRMIAGEIATLSPIERPPAAALPHAAGDSAVIASGYLQSGAGIYICPIGPARENGLDIWGTEGRLEILLEGLFARHSPRQDSRSTTNESEITVDRPRAIETTVSDAYLQLYDNLANHLIDRHPLMASLQTTLPSMKLVESILSAANAETG